MYKSFLESFLKEQDAPQSRRNNSYINALKEIKKGKKMSHWIWYVIPSWRAIRDTTQPEFLIPTPDAAAEYLKNDELRKRLVDIIDATSIHLEKGVSATDIYGGIDATKFYETTSLFACVSAVDKDIDLNTVNSFTRALLALNQNPSLHQRTVQGLKTYDDSKYSILFKDDLKNSTAIDYINETAKKIREI